jgi:hypothetical protein
VVSNTTYFAKNMILPEIHIAKHFAL